MIWPIFSKNLKTVSRNWNYFLVLVIFPIFLILLSGAVLNSASTDNIKVGLVNEGETVSLDFSSKVKQLYSHSSLSDCIAKMAEGSRAICIRVYTKDEKPQIDAYIDNTQKVVESYTKQFFLETILERQNLEIGHSEKIEDRLSVFSTSFQDARKELDVSFQELDRQEKILTAYSAEIFGTMESFPRDSPTRKLLERMQSNISNSIQSAQEGKRKIVVLLSKTEQGSKQIYSLKDSIRDKSVIYQIMDGIENVPKSPVANTFPLLVAIIITFTSLILSNLFISRQVNQSNYFRSLISPVKGYSFFIADFLINLFFVFIQSLFIFIVGFYMFNIQVISILPQLALVIFLSSSIFIFLGMSFGYLFKSENLSMLVSIFVVILFQIFSDILAPPALVGPAVGFFMSINPFVILENLLRDLIVIDRPMTLLIPSLSKLLILFLLSMGLAIAAQKARKKKALE
ncbi:ABC transporter permease [Candidatus Pacearchaeota archaeon]|nr:ABC transporter permease [Candidatus Pacearchaeota archaeon]